MIMKNYELTLFQIPNNANTREYMWVGPFCSAHCICKAYHSSSEYRNKGHTRSRIFNAVLGSYLGRWRQSSNKFCWFSEIPLSVVALSEILEDLNTKPKKGCKCNCFVKCSVHLFSSFWYSKSLTVPTGRFGWCRRIWMLFNLYHHKTFVATSEV